MAILSTSGGCPYNCIFCFSPWKKVRFRNPSKVIEELKLLKEEYGVNYVNFSDDNFTINKKMFFNCAIF